MIDTLILTAFYEPHPELEICVRPGTPASAELANERINWEDLSCVDVRERGDCYIAYVGGG